MTPTHPVSPERDADDLALQLDPFSGLTAEHAVVERGVSRSIARASSSPAWWRYVAILYDGYADITIEECREPDAALILRAVERDGTPLRNIVRDICHSVERTGGGPLRKSAAFTPVARASPEPDCPGEP
jgi:hypothetical protein